MSTQPTRWVGICGRCGERAPEERDNEAEALQDAADCPCRNETEDVTE